MEGDPKIAQWLGKEIYRALQGALFLTHTQVPHVQRLIHEQGSLLQSIYQVLSLLLLAAVIAFKWLSCPCWIHKEGGPSSWWRCGTTSPYPGRDTVTPAHTRLFPGWQWTQHRLGGPTLFTPTAARTGLFKQSGCLHKLPLIPWTSSGRRVLMWPFPGAPWIVYAAERERERDVASCRTLTTAPLVPVVWPDNCRPKKMVEQNQDLGSLAALINIWILELKPPANDSTFSHSTVLPAPSAITVYSLHHLLPAPYRWSLLRSCSNVSSGKISNMLIVMIFILTFNINQQKDSNGIAIIESKRQKKPGFKNVSHFGFIG